MALRRHGGGGPSAGRRRTGRAAKAVEPTLPDHRTSRAGAPLRSSKREGHDRDPRRRAPSDAGKRGHNGDQPDGAALRRQGGADRRCDFGHRPQDRGAVRARGRQGRVLRRPGRARRRGRGGHPQDGRRHGLRAGRHARRGGPARPDRRRGGAGRPPGRGLQQRGHRHAPEPTVAAAPEAHAKIIDTNQNGVRRAMRVQVPTTRREGGGVVFDTSSTSDSHAPATQTPCAAAMGAVDIMAEGVSNEVADDGIRVRGIAPGAIVATNLIRFIGRDHTPEEVEVFGTPHAIGRAGRPVPMARRSRIRDRFLPQGGPGPGAARADRDPVPSGGNGPRRADASGDPLGPTAARSNRRLASENGHGRRNGRRRSTCRRTPGARGRGPAPTPGRSPTRPAPPGQFRRGSRHRSGGPPRRPRWGTRNRARHVDPDPDAVVGRLDAAMRFARPARLRAGSTSQLMRRSRTACPGPSRPATAPRPRPPTVLRCGRADRRPSGSTPASVRIRCHRASVPASPRRGRNPDLPLLRGSFRPSARTDARSRGQSTARRPAGAEDPSRAAARPGLDGSAALTAPLSGHPRHARTPG